MQSFPIMLHNQSHIQSNHLINGSSEVLPTSPDTPLAFPSSPLGKGSKSVICPASLLLSALSSSNRRNPSSSLSRSVEDKNLTTGLSLITSIRLLSLRSSGVLPSGTTPESEVNSRAVPGRLPPCNQPFIEPRAGARGLGGVRRHRIRNHDRFGCRRDCLLGSGFATAGFRGFEAGESSTSETLSWLGIEGYCSAGVFLFRAIPVSFVCFHPAFREGSNE